MDENDVYFSFLPLAHIFDRVTEEFYVFVGGSIGFWQGVRLACMSLSHAWLTKWNGTQMLVFLQFSKSDPHAARDRMPNVFNVLP